MKNIIFAFFLIFSSFSLVAQIRNTSWKGAIKGDNPRDVILDFHKDSITVYSATDNSVVERMIYSAKNGVITLHKVDGQSDCDNEIVGKYKFVVKSGKLFVTLLRDSCDDRSSALNSTKWTKSKE